MTGNQYVLFHAQPPLFIIRKHRRTSINNTIPLCYYYVLDGNVYQAPDLHTLVQSRLVGALEPLRQAMAETIKCLRFDPAKGHTWEFRSTPAKHSSEVVAGDGGGGSKVGSGRGGSG